MGTLDARFRTTLLAVILCLSWAGTSYADLAPYSARYSLYRNGKLTGKVEIALQQEGDRWAIKSEGSGTHGLARILRARDKEHVTLRVEEGHLRPERYTRHTRVAGIDDRWESIFDWESDAVTIIHDEDESFRLELNGSALDPLSMKLEMRRRLGQPEPDLRFHMVEEDEIDEQNFRILRSEWLETSLGCLRTTPVEKIRHNSKRYTRAWHAPEFNNIEVRAEHGKTGGSHLEMRITELTLHGETVAPRPGCSARQVSDGEAP
jgi:hypothetical protein